jgi:hypothetical protein
LEIHVRDEEWGEFMGIDVEVWIHGFTHDHPDDVDMLLVAPTEESWLLMSDAGGSQPVQNATLVFVSKAAGARLIGDDSGLLTGSVNWPLLCSNYDDPPDPPEASFPDPIGGGMSPPKAPYGSSMVEGRPSFNPNGTWRLYIVDDNAGATGSITGSWTLKFIRP